MSKRTRTQANPRATTLVDQAAGESLAAVLDPPESEPTESGPPSAEELGITTLAESPDALLVPIDENGKAKQPTMADIVPPSAPVMPRGPDCSAIVTGLDQQSAAAWPAESPFQVDWPWGAEPDPVPGDIVGWNWRRDEILLVTAVPPVMEQWPYRLTCEIRPMPNAWQYVKVYNLDSAQPVGDLDWYTRWNRAYGEIVADANGLVAIAEDGVSPVLTIGSGWLAVVKQEQT